jgi:hypothetical protein
MKKFFLLVVLGALVWQGYAKYRPSANEITATAGSAPEKVTIDDVKSVSDDHFACDGRAYCSQMKSCEEAEYFLKNCPGVKMDGNNDGVPCEKQWCR